MKMRIADFFLKRCANIQTNAYKAKSNFMQKGVFALNLTQILRQVFL